MIYINGNKVDFQIFPNKEKRLDLDFEQILENRVGTYEKVIWQWQSDEDIFELLLLDSVLNNFNSYDLYIPYMPYSRMDRVYERNTAFSLDVLTTLLAQQLKAVNSIYVLDPHSEKTLDFLKWKFNTSSTRKIGEWDYNLAKDVLSNVDTSNVWIVFPDKGAANRYNTDDYENVIICEKVRDFTTGKIQGVKAHIEKQQTNNNFMPLYIIDDLCSYGGTFVASLKSIKEDLEIIPKTSNLIVTHSEEGLLKGSVLNNFDKVYTTDSLAKIDHEAVTVKSILEI